MLKICIIKAFRIVVTDSFIGKYTSEIRTHPERIPKADVLLPSCKCIMLACVLAHCQHFYFLPNLHLKQF